MSQAQPFVFQSQQIRTIVIDGHPWFVAKDVCAALGIQWTGKFLYNIPDAWQGVRKLLTPSGARGGGNQNLRIISEPAVYKLAFRSNKPEADAFTNWVASEVLPAIRKTGKFEAKPKTLPAPKQKALPPAPQPSYREKCAEVTAKMIRLRGDLFIVSSEMMEIFRDPFWGPAGTIPENKEPFAASMNRAIQSFFMAVNKDIEAAELLFNAYVEGEKMMRY